MKSGKSREIGLIDSSIVCLFESWTNIKHMFSDLSSKAFKSALAEFKFKFSALLINTNLTLLLNEDLLIKVTKKKLVKL